MCGLITARVANPLVFNSVVSPIRQLRVWTAWCCRSMSERISITILLRACFRLGLSSLRRVENNWMRTSVRFATPLSLNMLGRFFVVISAFGLHMKRWKLGNRSASFSHQLASSVTRSVVSASLIPFWKNRFTISFVSPREIEVSATLYFWGIPPKSRLSRSLYPVLDRPGKFSFWRRRAQVYKKRQC